MIPPATALQISGRAGRYASQFTEGEVTTFSANDLPLLHKLLNTAVDPLEVHHTPCYEIHVVEIDQILCACRVDNRSLLLHLFLLLTFCCLFICSKLGYIQLLNKLSYLHIICQRRRCPT